jgi:cytochrome c oxidase subunit 1
MHLTDHKTVGLQYGLTALVFLLLGFLLMLVMRWQLAWPTSPLPPIFASVVGGTNAPSGYMLPEFYNQLVAMHGTVMIFLAVVPMLVGAFGNYLVPLQIGARDMAFPRLNAASYWLFLAAGIVMVVSFFAPGGAPNSGWTSYPPLAILATRGQDYWLVGIFLLGASSMLNSINVITTVMHLRATGILLMKLPFFVWSQVIAAVLLLLAFPALQAAAIFQFMDRVAGTSFFLPSGLYVAGAPLEGPTGGGDPMLWQHLFWFLGHPEVYVLILPALGIVAEVIATNTRRPLWGYRGMVASVLFIGFMSFVVWAHHMFLTGMSTTLSTFFQVTTMIISIPSVVLITSLMLSLWGGSIRFTLPMLFALAFIPMFGLGGLSGLPLGLAASDVQLHDTWYVVGHFHFLVAPGTLFAIFAGIYYWFPRVTGRSLNKVLGHLHFWGSFFAIQHIFLPMFAMGLMGVNRRLYDGGLQYTHAQPALGWNVTMTWWAVILGAFQIPLVVNIVLSLWRGTAAAPNPWNASTLEWRTASSAHEIETRDATAPAARTGMWLFIASEVMVFASLFAAYWLLRTGSPIWPDATGVFTLSSALVMTAVLFGATALCSFGSPSSLRARLFGASALAIVFAVLKVLDYNAKIDAGLTPSTNLLLASWFVLTGVHAAHVAAGAVANVWVAVGTSMETRPRALRLYWYFVDAVWLVILAAFYVM